MECLVAIIMFGPEVEGCTGTRACDTCAPPPRPLQEEEQHQLAAAQAELERALQAHDAAARTAAEAENSVARWACTSPVCVCVHLAMRASTPHRQPPFPLTRVAKRLFWARVSGMQKRNKRSTCSA